MQLSDRSTTFRAPTGEMVIVTFLSSEDTFVSYDGNIFYMVIQLGFGGTNHEFHMSFNDPINGVTGDVFRKFDELTWDDKTLIRVPNPDEIVVVPLPSERAPVYLLQLPDGQFIYVSVDKYHYTYESFKLFIGNPDAMREISVKGVERFRDGGTTYVRSEEGILFFPSPFLEEVPTWNEVAITKLNPKSFTITETQDGVTIAE